MHDNEILEKILIIRKQEKNYTLKVLEYLEIIDKRKLYVDKGYFSLFAYCVEELDYSKAEAAIRVNATRLIKYQPQTKTMLQNNELSLSSAAQVQSFFKQEKVAPKIKKEIIQKVKNKSKRETIKILNAMSPRKIEEKTIKLNERLLEKLQKLQNLLNTEDELETIEVLVEQKIKELELNKKERQQSGSKNQRYISRKAKQFVFKRDQHRCQQCGSRKILQLDHIRPISQGGSGRPENLQLLCFACNQRRFIKTKCGKFHPKVKTTLLGKT